MPVHFRGQHAWVGVAVPLFVTVVVQIYAVDSHVIPQLDPIAQQPMLPAVFMMQYWEFSQQKSGLLTSTPKLCQSHACLK